MQQRGYFCTSTGVLYIQKQLRHQERLHEESWPHQTCNKLYTDLDTWVRCIKLSSQDKVLVKIVCIVLKHVYTAEFTD